MKRKTLIIVLVLLQFGATAQWYLYVQRNKKSIAFHPNDQISVSVDGHRYSGKIAYFTDSSFVYANNREVPVRAIEAIYRQNPRQSSINTLYVAAAILPLADMINNGTPVNNNVLLVSSSIAASGLMLQLLFKHKIKIGKKARIYLLKMPIAPSKVLVFS